MALRASDHRYLGELARVVAERWGQPFRISADYWPGPTMEEPNLAITVKFPTWGFKLVVPSDHRTDGERTRQRRLERVLRDPHLNSHTGEQVAVLVPGREHFDRIFGEEGR